MVYEEIPLKVDVARLQEYFRANVLPLEPVMTSPHFGGWSIQSPSGHYTDGWQPGHLCFVDDGYGGKQWSEIKAAAIGFMPREEHKELSQVAAGYVKEVVDMVDEAGLHPRRMRWSILRAHGRSSLHRDFDADDVAVRIHIPIITNPKCYFQADGESQHIPADGRCYLTRVNRLHQIFNDSDEDRVHIIADVWDSKWISQHHRLPRRGGFKL